MARNCPISVVVDVGAENLTTRQPRSDETSAQGLGYPVLMRKSGESEVQLTCLVGNKRIHAIRRVMETQGYDPRLRFVIAEIYKPSKIHALSSLLSADPVSAAIYERRNSDLLRDICLNLGYPQFHRKGFRALAALHSISLELPTCPPRRSLPVPKPTTKDHGSPTLVSALPPLIENVAPAPGDPFNFSTANDHPLYKRLWHACKSSPDIDQELKTDTVIGKFMAKWGRAPFAREALLIVGACSMPTVARTDAHASLQLSQFNDLSDADISRPSTEGFRDGGVRVSTSSPAARLYPSKCN